eukprot:TRINITY_DN4393_c0_g1_i3.p1 TRINITY_DN4393_c0_g1~~TRINITY_DN4393_c0_g1_i3.p1  ORF type:complete len:205 (-),score=33.88 TRINITY_DN4393_c0_g1_i3:446-1060(-)
MPQELVRLPTTQLMDNHAKAGPILVVAIPCFFGVCCFWLPMIFWMAADNLLASCESYDNFKLWFRLYAVVPICVVTLMQLIVSILARAGNGAVFKLGLRLQICSALVQTGLIIWGWIEYMKTSEDKCVDPDDGINPRTLAMVFLAMASIGTPGVVCGVLKKATGDVNQVPKDQAGCGDADMAYAQEAPEVMGASGDNDVEKCKE